MTTMRTIALIYFALVLAASPALALNDTIGVTAGSGKTANLIKFVSNNVISEAGICDATTENQCATVSAAGALSVSVPTWAGGTLGAMANYGTSPGAVLVPGVNAFVTNANTNGPASAANSSPVVLGVSGNSVSALTATTCGSAVSTCQLKNGAGNFYGVYAECTSACWLMIFNQTATPTNGATTAGTASGNLVECVDIAANSARSISYPVFPVNFSVGVYAAISSTACATLTLSTVGFIRGTVL